MSSCSVATSASGATVGTIDGSEIEEDSDTVGGTVFGSAFFSTMVVEIKSRNSLSSPVDTTERRLGGAVLTI